MTIPDRPTYPVTLRYGCGCVDRWLVYRPPDPLDPDQEPDRSIDEDCTPIACNDCGPVLQTARGCRCPDGRQNVTGRPLVEQRKRITLLEEHG